MDMVLVSQMDKGRERIEGEKFIGFPIGFLIPATSRGRVGGSSFLSMFLTSLWSWFVK